MMVEWIFNYLFIKYELYFAIPCISILILIIIATIFIVRKELKENNNVIK